MDTLLGPTFFLPYFQQELFAFRTNKQGELFDLLHPTPHRIAYAIILYFNNVIKEGKAP